MTLAQALIVLDFMLCKAYPDESSEEHKALLVAARSMDALRKLKEVLDACGDLYKTTR